jgi:hypothetical protein
MLQRRIGFASALIVLLACGGAEAASHQRAIIVDHWKVTCRPGDDEFASNCQATAKAKGLVFEFATGDSQLFLTVVAPGCVPAGAGDGVDANWWRDEIAAMGVRARRTLLVNAMQMGSEQLGARCSIAPGQLVVRHLPDIAVRGDP